MTRAVLLLLDGRQHNRERLGQILGNPFALMPQDDDHMLRGDGLGDCHDMTHERTAADLVQNLGSVRFHPGALARSENNHRRRRGHRQLLRNRQVRLSKDTRCRAFTSAAD